MNNTFVALLRGINVGGNNKIAMTELKACFEALGFSSVSTYIQSGNVLFSTNEANHTLLTQQIEQALSKRFAPYIARIVLRSAVQMKGIVENAPQDFGKDPNTYRYDVLFVKEPLRVSEAIKSIPVKEEVDQVFAGESVIYFSRLISKATQSRLSRIVQLPLYQQITIRNWNTTTKLQKLLEESSKM